MIRRFTLSLPMAGVLALLAASADLPNAWRGWHYSRTIQNGDTDGQPTQVTLPWEIYPHCFGDCDDLRIVDSRGKEAPYVRQATVATHNVESHAAKLVENSFVADHYTQIIGDLGQDHPAYDRVRVETTEPDFIVWAEIALSDDAKTWRILEPRAPIARFRSRAVEGTQSIVIQGLSSRYVRARIAEPAARFPVTGITVLHESETVSKVPFLDAPTAFISELSADSSETVWRTTLPSLNQPISTLTIRTGSREFYRAVRISGSVDGEEWRPLGSGVIYRYAQESKTRDSLTVSFPEAAGNQFIRVAVINGNDQPLSGVGFSLAAAARRVAFKEAAGESYRLLYGNERAGGAQYDLSHFMSQSPARPYRYVSMGEEEATTNYRDPRPFTESHPFILWSALGIAIVLIGITALRTLRTPMRTSPGSAKS